MKHKARIGIVVLAAVIVFTLVAGNVFAFSNVENDNCSKSGCHDSLTGMSITTVSTIDVAPGETFQVDVVATGLGTDLVLRIPAGIENNDDFTIVIPTGTDGAGRVDDNDAMDLDPADEAIHAIYNITAPAFAGAFTLAIYAAQHTPSSISSLITVNVVQESGAAIGAPSTNPEVPGANQEFNVTVSVTSEETITYVRLQYSINNASTWTNVTMSELSSGVYSGIIPGFQNGQLVVWRIVAADASGVETVSPTLTYIVGQIPVEPIDIPQFHYGWLLGAPALFFAYL
ncbi:hypothetical protein E4H12_13385, partial [Candidatus Thorarchaeota archaeon]